MKMKKSIVLLVKHRLFSQRSVPDCGGNAGFFGGILKELRF